MSTPDVRGVRQPGSAKDISGYLSVPQSSLYQRTADRMNRMKFGESITVETGGSIDALRALVSYGRMFTRRPFRCVTIDSKTILIRLG